MSFKTTLSYGEHECRRSLAFISESRITNKRTEVPFGYYNRFILSAIPHLSSVGQLDRLEIHPTEQQLLAIIIFQVVSEFPTAFAEAVANNDEFNRVIRQVLRGFNLNELLEAYTSAAKSEFGP